MTVLPTPIVVTMWVLLLGFAGLLFILYRQMAYLLDLGRGTGQEVGGIEVGSPVPRFTYDLLMHSGQPVRKTFIADGRPTLLMFTDPRCTSCERAFSALEREVGDEPPDDIRILAVTDAEATLVAAVETYRRSHLEIGLVDHSVPLNLFKTYVTPYFYGLDGHGHVVCRGVGVDGGDLRRLLKEVMLARESAGRSDGVSGKERERRVKRVE